MKKIIVILVLAFSVPTFGQITSTISVMDFVKVKDNKFSEALYYYENNWKAYREVALKRNFIASFKLLRTSADSIANFNLVLITEFTDSLQFQLMENRFQAIIKELRPDGPKLLNNLQPNEFRQNVFMKETQTVFSSNLRD